MAAFVKFVSLDEVAGEMDSSAESRLAQVEPRPVSLEIWHVNGLAAIGLAPLPMETEDSVLTGGTRSLGRRLLGLNVGGSLRKRSKGVEPVRARAGGSVKPKVA